MVQAACLCSALKGECLEIWLVGPVSAYNVIGWGAPVKRLFVKERLNPKPGLFVLQMDRSASQTGVYGWVGYTLIHLSSVLHYVVIND